MFLKLLPDDQAIFNMHTNDSDIKDPQDYAENLDIIHRRQSVYFKLALGSVLFNIALGALLFFTVGHIVAIVTAAFISLFTSLMVYAVTMCDSYIIENKKLMNRSAKVYEERMLRELEFARRTANNGPIAYKKALPRFEVGT